MQLGPYRTVEEIARGGMGVVYRAEDPQGRLVALKVILAHRAGDARTRRRFEREVDALCRLDHPHVVRIHAAGEHDGCPWLALDFVAGESLQERLRRGPLPIPEAVRLGGQLARALSYVHARGLLHRDLKPDNVLLREGDALLTDFGLVLDEDVERSRLSATGIFQGTPGYWAPEQARGEIHDFGVWTDVYGLGGVLYACLTGQAPVQASSLQDYLQTFRFKATVPPRELRPEVPEWLSALCLRCLATAPGDRPASADEVARALELQGAAKPSGADAPGRSLVASALVVAALGVTGLGLVASWFGGAQESGRARAEPPGHSAATPPDARPADASPASVPGFGALAAEAQALLAAAEREAQLGRHEAAIELAAGALEIEPAFARAYAIRGQSLRELQRFEGALDDFERAFALALEPDYLNLVASAKQSLGRHEEAIADFDRALALGAPVFGTCASRGLSKASLGRHEEAIADYDRALDVEPGSMLVLMARAHAKRGVKRWAAAIADYDRIIELGSQGTEALAGRGACKAELGDYEGAIADADRVIELDRSAVAYRARGSFKGALGRHREAIADFDRSIELDPNEMSVWVNRAISRGKVGDLAEAISDLDWVEAQVGTLSGEAYALRGGCKAALRRFEEALADYARALELGDRRAVVFANRASSLGDLGRFLEAIEAYDRAIELEPLPTYYSRRGACKAACGRHEEGAADYDRAIDAGLREAKTFANRGLSRFALGQHEGAVDDFDRALELAPTYVKAYGYRGRAKARLGRYAEAILDLDRALELGLASEPLTEEVRAVRAEALAALEREASPASAGD